MTFDSVKLIELMIINKQKPNKKSIIKQTKTDCDDDDVSYLYKQTQLN